MKAKTKPLTALILLAGIGLASTAEAALISRLGGLAVYDTDRNITWLQNANANGQMTWATAKTWAEGLNIGGFTGWRLPTSLNADGSGPCSDYNCIGSELGHLFYTVGGLAEGQEITSSAVLSGLFSNMQSSMYWSGTVYATNPSNAWYFITANGNQSITHKLNNYYAWAVRDGDVVGGGSVPEPGIIGLLGIGALAWAGTKQKRRG
jgi:hypothetical protein